MKVVFRADASVESGSGHVMRCLTLAESLRQQGVQCSFICREHPGHLAVEIRQREFEVSLLPIAEGSDFAGEEYAAWLGDTWQRDAADSLSILGEDTDWLVVDHYALDYRWEQILAPAVGRVMVIDDLANRAHTCDFLLDQNLGKQEEDYALLVPEACHCMVGPGYALLRQEFSAWREQSLKRKRAQGRIKRILVSLGGADQDNATEWVLGLLTHTALSDSVHLDVVMGASSPHLQKIQRMESTSRFDVTVSVNVDDMAERMALADLSIGAAGSTTWERCCLGLPSVMLVLANNQRFIAEQVQVSGAGVLLDRNNSNEQLIQQLDDVLSCQERLDEMSRLAADICSGEGALRVSSMILDRGAI